MGEWLTFHFSHSLLPSLPPSLPQFSHDRKSTYTKKTGGKQQQMDECSHTPLSFTLSYPPSPPKFFIYLLHHFQVVRRECGHGRLHFLGSLGLEVRLAVEELREGGREGEREG